MEPENGWLEDEISFGGGLFSGAMLVSGRVTPKNINMEPEKHHDLHMAFAFPEVYIYIYSIYFSVFQCQSWFLVWFHGCLLVFSRAWKLQEPPSFTNLIPRHYA